MRIGLVALRTWVSDVLTAVGMRPGDAEALADSLVAADLRGVDTHGVTRLPIYVQRMRAGLINVRPEISVERLAPSCGMVDADDGPGQLATLRAIDHAVGLADATGAGVVGVRRSNHFGAAAQYTLRAAEAGMVGIAMTHAEADVVPFGGRTAMLGTNPVSIAVPTPDDVPPLVIDMATSAVAMGKVLLARQEDRAIPEHVAVDREGQPTTDPHAARAVVPAAGPKGYGLAVIIDVLSSVLTGTASGPDVRRMYDDFTAPQGLGHLVAAIDVRAFVPLAACHEAVGAYVARLREAPAVDGVTQVLVPGELEARAEARNRADGVPLSAGLADELTALGAELGVGPPPAV